MPADDLASTLLGVLLTSHPLDASILGLTGYDDKLPDLSSEAQDEEVAALRRVAADAARLGDAVDEVERQTADLVRTSAGARADAAAVPIVEFTVADFHSAPVTEVLMMLTKVPLDTAARKDAYLARLEGLGGVLERALERHLAGVGAGRLPVRRLVRAAVAQLDAFLADPELGGIRRATAADGEFVDRLDRTLEATVRPALGAYRDALSSRLVDAGRDDDHCGLRHLPDGDVMYAALTRLHTSTDRTPGELHDMGVEIVERVNDEYRQLGGRLWGLTDLGAVIERLRDDPSLRYEDAEQILSDARTVVARAEEAAPAWFGELPATSCKVEPVPAVEEAGSAPAYYLPPALDGSRDGTYFVNTSRATERSRADAETIAFHEAVPGHHFQLAIAQNQPGLSLPRRVLWDTACAEGWGLYAERLADEMGLYSSDLARLGMLTADMWRAGRLVVDTGIHAQGWTRERAVEWFGAHTPLPAVVIEAEVNRYIANPGQALAYMVGRVELVRLRREATERLGARFDLRGFHDVVLRAGPLPLPAMAGVVERWAAKVGETRVGGRPGRG
ncbi:MAG TPA: DUF885 domain-containing protein [Acidimicrobiales bacterium]|nr:DUF885 domain-containing protein [Acidimicrobiales bacterium]